MLPIIIIDKKARDIKNYCNQIVLLILNAEQVG